MNSPRDRLILGIASIFVFLMSTIFVGASSHLLDTDSQLYMNLICTLIFTFNITILFAWMAFGLIGGAASAIFVALLSFFINLKIGVTSHLLLIAPFFTSSLIGYAYWRTTGDLEQTYQLKKEKLEEDINLLARGINNRRAEIDSLRKKFERYATLKGVAEVLSTTLSLDEIAAFITDSSMKIIGKAQRCILYLVDIEKQELSLCASKAILKEGYKIKYKRGDVFDLWVLRQRKTLMLEDITRDFRFSQDDQEMGKKYFRSLISAPLVRENKVIGILRLDSPKELIFAQDDLRLLDIISDLAAVAVENCFLYQRTEELARRDGLTNLAVRRYFMERLLEEIRRSAITKATFSILMIDTDHFKKYNDRFGHIAGDLVLKYFANLLSASVKKGDIVARYGGEEFVVILLKKGKEAALKEAEAIRKKVENEPLILRRQKMKLTISVGVANYTADASLAEELIKKADDNLYRAKRSGRNRVCG